MPNTIPPPKKPHLPSFPTGKHKPFDRAQLEKSTREQAHQKRVEEMEKRIENERAKKTLQEREQQRDKQATTEDAKAKQQKEKKQLGLIDTKNLQVQQEKDKVKLDKALPSAPYDPMLREKYGIFYD